MGGNKRGPVLCPAGHARKLQYGGKHFIDVFGPFGDVDHLIDYAVDEFHLIQELPEVWTVPPPTVTGTGGTDIPFIQISAWNPVIDADDQSAHDIFDHPMFGDYNLC